MKEIEAEEKFFCDFISKSKLNVPSPDFEDNVMVQINKSLSKRTSISRELKLSWIFLILGSVFGVIVSITLPNLNQPILGIHIDKLSIIFSIIFVLLLITQLDNLTSFYNRHQYKN